MDRLRSLARLWSWLPAFRAVAETEHLPTAATAMHLSPSALSRGVTQLEHALGVELFARSGRRLQLTLHGDRVLGAVRDAMRLIDDALIELAPDRQPRRLVVAAQAPWIGTLVLPATRGLGDRLAIEVVDVDGDSARRLLRGDIDLVVDTSVGGGDEVDRQRLCSIARAVCCGRGHRLARSRRRIAFGEIARHVFAAYDINDGWPEEHRRVVALRSRRLEVILDACASGEFVAVVPVTLARARDLHVLTPVVSSVLYVSRRRPLGESPIDGIIEALREQAKQLE